MIAITGDVHGCLRTLESTVKKITKRVSVRKWYFLGDIVDRGSKSLETTRLLMDLSKDFEVKFLLGNHEDMMLSYLSNDNRYPHMMWAANGGGGTIQSFTANKYNKSHAERHFMDICSYFAPYLDFFKTFSLYEEFTAGGQKFLLSHAGAMDCRLPLKEQDLPYSETERMRHPNFLWRKQAIHNHKGYQNCVVVFGHTPVLKIPCCQTPHKPFFVKHKKKITAVAMDTGCAYGYALSTLLIDTDGSMKTVSVPCKD